MYLNILRLPGFEPKVVTSTGVAAAAGKIVACSSSADAPQTPIAVPQNTLTSLLILFANADLMFTLSLFIMPLLRRGYHDKCGETGRSHYVHCCTAHCSAQKQPLSVI